ncbi:MAG TPA: hypothetical protein EYP54_02665 [Anaerolineales bacterium]|nr:hypothetical protein [Anaerolineales bacterium]
MLENLRFYGRAYGLSNALLQERIAERAEYTPRQVQSPREHTILVYPWKSPCPTPPANSSPAWRRGRVSVRAKRSAHLPPSLPS